MPKIITFEPMRFLLSIVFLLVTTSVFAQNGGNGTYQFLKLSPSARITALGGNLISVKDDDLNNAFQNPALLNSSMDGFATFSFVNYFSDVKYGYAAFARDYGRIGTFSFGLQFIQYGDFEETNNEGELTGRIFDGGEYNLNIGYAYPIDEFFSVGTNVKGIISNLETYNSFAVAGDVGITFYNEATTFTAALVAKNIGYQVKTFTNGNREDLPFEIQFGISQKLANAPFRYSIIAHDLQKFDLTFEDPNDPNQQIDLATGQPIVKKIGVVEKAARHLIFGAELLLSQNFNLRVGYDYQRQKELSVQGVGGGGFSFGVGLKVKKISFSYGNASYSAAGASNHFSISANLNDIF